MILIGLAGQSCAGKNEAGRILEKLDWNVIDADEISRHLFSQNERNIFELFKEDALLFNVKIYDENNVFDKKTFSSFVFSTPKLLSKLEAFILPKIEEEIRKKICKIEAENADAKIAINAPTLHKTSLFFECSHILYIKANIFIRLYRAFNRDKGSAINILKRFFAQRNFASQYLAKKSDILAVSNNSTIESLEKSIKTAFQNVGLA